MIDASGMDHVNLWIAFFLGVPLGWARRTNHSGLVCSSSFGRIFPSWRKPLLIHLSQGVEYFSVFLAEVELLMVLEILYHVP